jgi:hypothetical protein
VLPLAVFAFSRVVDGVLIALAASDQAAREPKAGFVAIPAPADPGYLTALGNWDGQWYAEIARNGYPSDLPTENGVVQQNAWAYYPLYPALVRAGMVVPGVSFELAATAVSLLAGALAMVVLFRLVDRAGGRFNATSTVAALCFFPAAPVLQAAYTESLALLLLFLCLTLLRDRRFRLLLAVTGALALTRPIALPLAVVISLHALARWRRRHETEFPPRERWGYAVCAGFAVLSFAIWPVAAAVATGRADAYFLTQRAWVLDQSDGWPSWLAHLTKPGDRGVALAAAVALLILVVLVLRRDGRAWGPELRMWGVVYFVYILSTTRPTSSIVRYSMLTVVPAWPFPVEPRTALSRRAKRAVVVAIVAVGVPLQYLWLQWFFVPHPGNHGYP